MKTNRLESWFCLMLIMSLFIFGAKALGSAQYTCPMHPHYITTTAGTCPICGMDLVRLTPRVESATDSRSEPGVNLENKTKKEVLIEPEVIQRMGVRTAPAEKALFGTKIRSYGIVSENTREGQVITGRVTGWVEQLFITAVGDRVTEGDILFTLYSPELISAQQDYLAALSTSRLGRIDSSAQRLKSMGVGEKVIERLKKQRKKIEKVPYYATGSGLISHLAISHGSYIQPGSHIAHIQNYESVWVNASVAEKDLQFISKDSKATVTFPNLGNIERIALVDYIHPIIDQSSRTGKVRLVLENRAGQLKPGAYANVAFETQVDHRLSVPSEAILKSAEGDFVVIAKGEGRFQSKPVKTGVYNKGRTEIYQGIQEGEQIVVSGQFLIDSESSLRESFRKLERVQTPLSLIELNADQQLLMDHWVDLALYLHEATTQGLLLKPDNFLSVIEFNKQLLPLFRGSKLEFILEDAERAVTDVQTVITESERLEAMAQLVKALKPWVLQGRPKHYKQKGVQLHLDQATQYYWLQLGDNGVNPYSDGQTRKTNIQHKMNPKSEIGEAHVH